MLRKTDAFRADIQGLRAVAVLSVIAAHAGFSRLSGGFVGVDVFFVVSGYLIVGLLVREAQQHSRISILGFYARRARRILPAATLVLVATTAVAAYQLPLVRAAEVLRDAVWAACFGANLRFAAVETDYFAAAEPPSPLQHFWSLSVEEQFYLVIPLAMAAAVYVVRRRTGSVRLRHLGLLILSVSALSLAWSIHYTSVDETAAYFSTTARAWELGLGGLVAILVQSRAGRPDPGPSWLLGALGWAGAAMVAFAVLTFDAATAFPGVAALVPVVGTALMLAAGSTDAGGRSVLARLLSLRPMVLVGAWSYSLYLWHWPILEFAHHRWGRQLSLAEVAVVIVATFALSAATFYAVEEPFRRGVRWRAHLRAVVLYPLSVGLVVVTAVAANAYIDAQLDGLSDNPSVSVSDYESAGLSDNPAVALVQASVLAAEDRKPVPGDLEPALGEVRSSIAPLGDCDYREGMRRLCPTGTPSADRAIVVMGDSHARAWGPAFTRIGERHGYAVYHFVYSGCPANRDTRPDPANGQEWTACAEFKEWARGQVAELSPDLVVIANNAYGKGLPDQFDGLAWEVQQLRESADRVVLVGNLPTLPRMPGVCLSMRGVDLGSCLFEADGGHTRAQQRFGAVVTAEGGEFIDARPWFCAQGRCPSVIGRYIPMRDKDHISVEYAEALAAPVARALGIAGPDAPGPGRS